MISLSITHGHKYIIEMLVSRMSEDILLDLIDAAIHLAREQRRYLETLR